MATDEKFTDGLVQTRELAASINPRVRKSPFFDNTVEAGLASVSSYNHMWLPTGYGDPQAEYRRLTEGVAMWDVAAQRHIEVRGPGADDLVQLVTTVDISQVPPGSGIYAPVVDFDGTLLNDPVLLHFEDDSWRFSIADSDIRLWFDAIGRGRALDAKVTELDTATLAVQGPMANEVMSALGSGWAFELEHFERGMTEIDDLEIIVSRSGWSGSGGYELFLDDPGGADRLWRAVQHAGAEFGIGPGNPNQSERIENALLSYGTDTGFRADPLELGLGDHLDLDGADFIGRDALLSIRDDGPGRRLLGAVVAGDPIHRFGHPTPIATDGRHVGELRVAAWSPRYSCNLGLALVDAGMQAGDEGSAAMPSQRRSVRLVELPFAEHL